MTFFRLILCLTAASLCLSASSCDTENDAPAPEYPDAYSLCIIPLTTTYKAATLPLDNGLAFNYRFYEPLSKEPGKKYPMIIMLHGIDQRGTDNKKQLTVAPWGAYFLKYTYTHPMYVVLPQCPPDKYWSYNTRPWPFIPSEFPVEHEMSYVYDAVLRLIDYMISNYAVDPERVHIGGFSMGGVGVLDIATAAPERFASVTAISGGVNPERAKPAFAGKNVWIEVCADDKSAVKPENSRILAEALRGICNLEYHEHPTGGHTGFHLYKSDSYINWLYPLTR